MRYQVPMGPYHPALEEPYKLDLVCEREHVVDASLRIGFNFRGIEKLEELVGELGPENVPQL